ncbi:amino acid aminotransferase [Leeia oryzae]|uniref:amino acid aminotransferase n=1 Tax=Leeia oryzae TaxID=356662 RepID=UPI00037909C5|nr:aromatic amino acid transaminase [Leeia oryzae]
MLEFIQPAQPDPLWAMLSAYRADLRTDKLDLIVGVYRDEHGQTPTLRAVQQAETLLASEGDSKSYRGLTGNDAFNQAMTHLLLPPALHPRTTTVQTVGGTGALRLLCDMIASIHPDATLWISNPGYINHEPIARKAGLQVRHYPYLDPHGALNEAAMLDRLAQAKPGDVVLVHGCCHNPSGVDLSADQWATLSAFLQEKRLVPLIDIAYLGLGNGLTADTTGLRHMAETLDEVLIAASCSKNLGLYCERTGCAMVIGKSPTARTHIQSLLENLARSNYSMPPDHGAAVAARIMHTPALNALWMDELEQMRLRIRQLRHALTDQIAALGDYPALAAIRHHKGMFSLLPFDKPQMQQLRREFGIYGTDAGRINLAGLTEKNLPYLAQALVSTLHTDALDQEMVS